VQCCRLWNGHQFCEVAAIRKEKNNVNFQEKKQARTTQYLQCVLFQPTKLKH
jgi:hypothetical protein